jgi:hypothetical protein
MGSEEVNREYNQRDDEQDVNEAADRLLQEREAQQPEYQQHDCDDQKHLFTPMELEII